MRMLFIIVTIYSIGYSSVPDPCFITECNWTATGTPTLRAYRGSATNVASSYKIYYRKSGTTDWDSTTNGQISITSTGRWQIGNKCERSGNNVLTHSYYGITDIDSIINIQFNSDSLTATIGSYFMYSCWFNCSGVTTVSSGCNLPPDITAVTNEFLRYLFYGCSALSQLPVNFTLPPKITTVGNGFLRYMFFGCASLTGLSSGFKIPTGITTAGSDFMAYFMSGCDSVTELPVGFNIPQNVTTVAGNFLFAAWNNCSALQRLPYGFALPTGLSSAGTGYCDYVFSGTTNLLAGSLPLYFYADATDAFGGTSTVTPDSPTAGTTVYVQGSPKPPSSRQKSSLLFRSLRDKWLF